MSEIPMGTIDPERLGCSKRATVVFAEHAKGKTVSQIARELSMGEDTVRGEITGVWHDDKRKSRIISRAVREGDAE